MHIILNKKTGHKPVFLLPLHSHSQAIRLETFCEPQPNSPRIPLKDQGIIPI